MITVLSCRQFARSSLRCKILFQGPPEISVVSNVGSFYMVPDALRNREINVLVIDLELDGLKSIYELKAIIKNFP